MNATPNTKQTAHTPTPWEWDKWGNYLFSGGQYGTKVLGANGDGLVVMLDVDKTFLLTACNAHDELVAILAGIDATADSQLAEHIQFSRKRIRAALAKAGV